MRYPAFASTCITLLRPILPAGGCIRRASIAFFGRIPHVRKIWDAYRPHAATRLMWELVHDERYVANPAKGSGHNRGLAVDLTLMDSRTGRELDMGTGFDNFTDTAHADYSNLPPAVLANRLKLRRAMEAEGFTVLATEWWHFYWPNDRNYEVMDLGFGAILREYRKRNKGNRE
ncbi:MAG: peptidase M15 [Chitinophagaceae bacterium]|nr:MAG: peptidase M15 [Chitinophagaceae bacterium]